MTRQTAANFKMAKLRLPLLLSLLLPLFSNSEVSNLRGLTPDRNLIKDASTSTANCLVCNVAAADVQFKQGYLADRDEYLLCETDAADEPDGAANQFYSLDDLPADFVEKHKDLLHSGTSRICIPKGKTNRQARKIDFATDVVPTFLSERKDNKGQRQLLSPFGTHSVLAVVVSSSTTGEHDPNVNATILAGNLFGEGPLAQSANVASQYRKCSNGNLRIIPYSGTNVQNGVLYVKIPMAIAGSQVIPQVQNAVINATQTALKVKNLKSQARHILFCLPQGGFVGRSNYWVSYGFTNGVMSFLQDSMCTRLSAPMHEMGHNIGFYHSGLDSDAYGDKSGYMGYEYALTGHPQMCFNAQKNYLAGWFDDRKVSVDPLVNGAWFGTLIPPVDYAAAVGTMLNAVAVVNVGTLYFQLNSAKKFNSETRAHPNTVNIVSAFVPSSPKSTLSWLQASLAAGESYTYANFDGNVALIIEVCSITFGTIDVAKVSIYLKNGVQKSLCA